MQRDIYEKKYGSGKFAHILRNLLIVNKLRLDIFIRFNRMNKKFSLFAAACLMFAAQTFADVDPRIKQGAIFESQGKYEMALGEYRSMLAENSSNSVAYLAAANVRVKMKDYAGALANYRLAYKFDPKMSAAYEGAAKVYELLGDKKKAAEERAKDPKNSPAPEAAPVESAPAAEPVKTAEAPKAEPAKVEPTKVEPPKPVEKAAEPVKTAEAPAKPAEVKPVESKPVEAKPAEPVKNVKSAEPAETAKAAESALPADPFERGKALFAAGKYSEAAPLWREVLKKTPGHAGAYFYAGLTRFELGEYDKAEFNLKKGLEYKEEGNDANYFLACVYQKNGKSDLETKFLNNYLKKAAPNGKYRRKAENRLAELNAVAKAAEAEKKSSEVIASSESRQAAKADSVKPVEPKTADAGSTASGAAVDEVSIAGGIAKFRSGDLDGALQIYKILLESEQAPDARSFVLLQMGNIYREMRDFNSAVNRYREVVELFPDSEWAEEAERANRDATWLQKHSSELPRKK